MGQRFKGLGSLGHLAREVTCVRGNAGRHGGEGLRQSANFIARAVVQGEWVPPIGQVASRLIQPGQAPHHGAFDNIGRHHQHTDQGSDQDQNSHRQPRARHPDGGTGGGDDKPAHLGYPGQAHQLGLAINGQQQRSHLRLVINQGLHRGCHCRDFACIGKAVEQRFAHLLGLPLAHGGIVNEGEVPVRLNAPVSVNQHIG